MNLAHGGLRGLAVAGATEVAGASGGDHAIAVAIIGAGGGLAAVILSQAMGDRRRQRDEKKRIDHVAESTSEHADLSDRLLDQLEAKDAEIITLRKELDREKARRHG